MGESQKKGCGVWVKDKKRDVVLGEMVAQINGVWVRRLWCMGETVMVYG